jgi:hypothetical protein
MEIIGAIHNVYFVLYFKQAAKLHYGVTKKEALKLPFQNGKDNSVVMPESWVKNVLVICGSMDRGDIMRPCV